ncbi:hypothetical protein NQ317_000426, partial [Molorchus minor]
LADFLVTYPGWRNTTSRRSRELPYVERAVARKVVHPITSSPMSMTWRSFSSIRLWIRCIFPPSAYRLPMISLLGENATVTGWGRLSEGAHCRLYCKSFPTKNVKNQTVQVPIVSNDNCKSMFLRAEGIVYAENLPVCGSRNRRSGFLPGETLGSFAGKPASSGLQKAADS